MSFKIAAATVNGVDINQHFGASPSFTILELTDEGELLTSDIREIDYGCIAADDAVSCGAASGGGCCGNGRASARLSYTAQALADCEYLLAAGIGPGANRALAAHGIIGFQITGNILDAAGKIAAYKQKQLRFKQGSRGAGK
jgi:predicted Fe-Mo cluster-binding NifX family protein